MAASSHDSRSTKLQRRHTIMVCESPTDSKLAMQELPPLEEEEEPSPSEEQTPRLQRGSDSLLSGLPDHTLHNGHSLLRGGGAARHQGALYRSEHRRSLTSGLTAIPEDEDAADSGAGGAGGGRSDGGSVPSRRHSMPAAPHGVGGYSQWGVGVGDARWAGGGHCGGVGGGGGGRALAHSSSDSDSRRGRHPPSQFQPPSSGDAAVKSGAYGKGGQKGQDLALLTASEMMHVSWKTACQRGATNSASACQDCRPVPVSTACPPTPTPSSPLLLSS